ncbi:MAG: PEP-CTERM sorting domain-containing protein [Azonexus sp.]|uniref:PEP-CTERM sorting domain-containing protein n=1 Tax=Azonexus sp. TaxID=1872668 RepID=UPI002835E9C9|nr:PEP-CTERM sorting domain-containing protein [Azonexus sp.]MDR0776932.1 PEP-CTERM sorting domain-containing protein [Azonexus sp.]
MKQINKFLFAGLVFGAVLGSTSHASTVLYTQNFENPVGWVQGHYAGVHYADVSGQSVNSLYTNQPIGFTFSQANTVETIHLTGGTAFGTGYVDSTGQGGNYSIGMQNDVEDDRLGLSFDVGAYNFLNFQLDVSRLGLQGPSGPFADGAPSFRFSLYDNPTGVANLSGNGTLLSFVDLSGADSVNNFTLNWTTLVAALDASASTNGNVTLQIDLLSGGYATMDNFRIVASNTAGDMGNVPEPTTLALFTLGLAGFGFSRVKNRNSKK